MVGLSSTVVHGYRAHGLSTALSSLNPGSTLFPILAQSNTVVTGFSVLGFSALPGCRALNDGNGAWSVHKALFGID